MPLGTISTKYFDCVCIIVHGIIHTNSILLLKALFFIHSILGMWEEIIFIMVVNSHIIKINEKSLPSRYMVDAVWHYVS